MQNSHLKLKEIIWEITGRCNNKCEYCGSKESWHVPVDTEKIIKIAQNIAKFPPEEIDMSGGDPLLVNYETHKVVTGILKDKGVKCKIIINPKSIANPKSYTTLIVSNILELYDWIGLSINTEEELKLLISAFDKSFLKKSTIISNFNLQNIFMYDEIENFVKENDLTWQIQYTMYEDENNISAIYNNPKALNFFSEKIYNSISRGIKIVVADNANCGNCSAGMYSIGILWNGDVVPCLSMRSWLNVDQVVVGNILDDPDKEKIKGDPLKYIWQNRFDKYRFESFKCCKDHCKNKCVEINKNKSTKKQSKTWDWEKSGIIRILYGVFPSENVKVYGVVCPEYEYPKKNQDGVYMYAVPGSWGTTTSVYSVKIPPSSCEDNTNSTGTNNDK
jgi:MoaA/NifB/PqqE/SkfB family radical SAM enzyme